VTATPNRTRGWDWRLTVTVRRLGPFTVGGRGDRPILDRLFYFGGRRCVAAGGPSDHAMFLSRELATSPQGVRPRSRSRSRTRSLPCPPLRTALRPDAAWAAPGRSAYRMSPVRSP